MISLIALCTLVIRKVHSYGKSEFHLISLLTFHLRTRKVFISLNLIKFRLINCGNMKDNEGQTREMDSKKKKKEGFDGRDLIQPPHISLQCCRESLGDGPRADHWWLPQTIRMFYKPGRVFSDQDTCRSLSRPQSMTGPHVKLHAKIWQF